MPGHVGSLLAAHFLLAPLRRTKNGRTRRARLVKARRVACLDFRDSLPFVLHALRRLRPQWPQWHRGRRAPWTANGLFWRFIASWAFSCKTATCVIGAGHVQTSHVLGSLHIDLVMHDTFTCTLALALARRLHSGQQE